MKSGRPTNSLTRLNAMDPGRQSPRRAARSVWSAPQRTGGPSQFENKSGRRAGATAGFTLAEVLAALLFMAIVIPVALEGLHVASRAGAVAQRKGEAARVAQRLLNENLVMTNWNQSVQGGTLVEGQRQFRWSMRNDPWNQDLSQNVMRLLTVEVTFTVQNQDYSVRMSTLADSSQP